MVFYNFKSLSNYTIPKLAEEKQNLHINTNNNFLKKLNVKKKLSFQESIIAAIKLISKTIFTLGLGLLSQSLRNDYYFFIWERKKSQRIFVTQFLYTQILANQGSAKAQYECAQILMQIETSDDREKAFHYCKLAAHQGNAEAQYLLGTFYEEGLGIQDKSESRAKHYYRLAAAQNSIEAQLRLGQLYLNSSAEIAFKYFRLAADLGNREAQVQLSKMYINGIGTAKSLKSSVHYLKLIAKSSDATTLFHIASGYTLKGGFKSLIKALHYYKLAIKNGHVDAKLAYSNIAFRLGNKFAANKEDNSFYKQAIHYYKCALKYRECVVTSVTLGKLYLKKEQYEKAAKHLLNAAQKGDAEAQDIMAGLYKQGKGVAASEEQAAYYYQLAADQGISHSQYQIAHCYFDGDGVERNVETAIYYWKKAANLNNADSQYRLFILYQYGFATEKSLEKAQHYLNLAAKQGHEIAKSEVERQRKNKTWFNLFK